MLPKGTTGEDRGPMPNALVRKRCFVQMTGYEPVDLCGYSVRIDADA